MSDTPDTPDEFEIVQDDVENEPGTGVEKSRTITVSRNGTVSRVARFDFDAETRVYRFRRYGGVEMRFRGITFEQADVEALVFVGEYLRETRENVDVEMFVGAGDSDDDDSFEAGGRKMVIRINDRVIHLDDADAEISNEPKLVGQFSTWGCWKSSRIFEDHISIEVDGFITKETTTDAEGNGGEHIDGVNLSNRDWHLIEQAVKVIRHSSDDYADLYEKLRKIPRGDMIDDDE